MKSSGGGRKRGRPVVLSPEEKLKRERERWRRKKVRKRKEAADGRWQRGTNFGYFERLWVPHYDELIKVLVAAGLLDENDINIPARVDAAVDQFFDSNPSDARWDSPWTGLAGRSRKLSRSGSGIVRVRMTAELADRLVAWSCEDEFKKSRPDAREHLRQEYERAQNHRDECKAALLGLLPGPEYRLARLEFEKAEATCYRLLPLNEPAIDAAELAEFAESRRHDREFLRKTAEKALFQFYSSYVFDPPRFPCNCKLALPACDCISRFKPRKVPGVLPWPAKPKGAKVGKALVKRSLYSAPVPRWWRNPRRDDDPVIRSHAQVMEEQPPDD